MGDFPYVKIDNFLGMDITQDPLSLLPGQLYVNRNYLYLPTGGISERGGGAKLSNAPSASNPLYGIANYKNNSGSEFLICAQGTDMYYYSSGWNSLSLSLTSNQKTRFEEAGFDSGRALYACNGSDGIIKISGTTPSASSLTGDPANVTMLRLHKNRMFAIDKDTLYFSDVLAFDTWDTTNNKIRIAPGRDGFLKAIEVWGDSLFLFKEHAIYVLPNAADSDPATNWKILRTDAKTGTLSPDSVKRTRIGIMFLSTDYNVRVIGPQTTFSSAEYTLGDSGSPIVSEPIKSGLKGIIDSNNIQNVSAHTKDNLYFVSFQSINNSGSFNDKTYFADTDKYLRYEGIPQAQPFWGEFTGYDYNYFTDQTVSGYVKTYGVKGASGEVHEILNDDISNDNGLAIDSYAALGWVGIGGPGLYKKIKQINVVANTENWFLTLNFNTYRYNSALPNEGEGTERLYTTTTDDNIGVVGSAIVGTSTVGVIGVGSKIYRVSLKGHYFTAEFKNENADEPTKVNNLLVYYKPIRRR